MDKAKLIQLLEASQIRMYMSYTHIYCVDWPLLTPVCPTS